MSGPQAHDRVSGVVWGQRTRTTAEGLFWTFRPSLTSTWYDTFRPLVRPESVIEVTVGFVQEFDVRDQLAIRVPPQYTK